MFLVLIIPRFDCSVMALTVGEQCLWHRAKIYFRICGWALGVYVGVQHNVGGGQNNGNTARKSSFSFRNKS